MLVVGANESLAGDYVLVIEGGNIESDERDIFEVRVTPRMVSAFEFLTAYAFAGDEQIDPVLTWESSPDELITCDNSGIEGDCQEASPSLQGTSILLANDDSVIGVRLNAMLQIPIDEGMEGHPVPLQVTAAEGTSGEYLLILHIITD
jgi:hypothetical protein